MSDTQPKIAPGTDSFFSEPDPETVHAEHADMVLESEVKELLSGKLGWVDGDIAAKAAYILKLGIATIKSGHPSLTFLSYVAACVRKHLDTWISLDKAFHRSTPVGKPIRDPALDDVVVNAFYEAAYVSKHEAPAEERSPNELRNWAFEVAFKTHHGKSIAEFKSLRLDPKSIDNLKVYTRKLCRVGVYTIPKHAASKRGCELNLAKISWNILRSPLSDLFGKLWTPSTTRSKKCPNILSHSAFPTTCR